ncbi:MAG: Crp/Fnr family transcriptional regulator [Rufibacter sp.]
MQKIEVKNRGYLLREGEVCHGVYFICSGCCRTVYNQEGVEINTNFSFEGDFVTNIKSLTQNIPSEYSMVACEPVVAIRLEKDKLLAAYQASHEIEKLGRILLEKIAAQQEEHTALFKLLSAQQRYAYLEEKQPQLLQRISLSHLSSYLGVTRETLSRIRSRRMAR